MKHIMHDLGDLAGLDLALRDRSSVERADQPGAPGSPRSSGWGAILAWLALFRPRRASGADGRCHGPAEARHR